MSYRDILQASDARYACTALTSPDQLDSRTRRNCQYLQWTSSASALAERIDGVRKMDHAIYINGEATTALGRSHASLVDPMQTYAMTRDHDEPLEPGTVFSVFQVAREQAVRVWTDGDGP